mmetsp:Transcript_5687/g.20682  ORF Transcript_5687/g.20682 Transcript_5687/m.20682 type:complete len:274 (-) Transcript_5687:1404-2225(-)
MHTAHKQYNRSRIRDIQRGAHPISHFVLALKHACVGPDVKMLKPVSTLLRWMLRKPICNSLGAGKCSVQQGRVCSRVEGIASILPGWGNHVDVVHEESIGVNGLHEWQEQVSQFAVGNEDHIGNPRLQKVAYKLWNPVPFEEGWQHKDIRGNLMVPVCPRPYERALDRIVRSLHCNHRDMPAKSLHQPTKQVDVEKVRASNLQPGRKQQHAGAARPLAQRVGDHVWAMLVLIERQRGKASGGASLCEGCDAHGISGGGRDRRCLRVQRGVAAA